MKMKLAEIAPGMWFREHGSEAIHVKLSGPVIRGVAAVYKSANINTGILGCPYGPGFPKLDDVEFEIVEKPKGW